jgi:hypothetical protein
VSEKLDRKSIMLNQLIAFFPITQGNSWGIRHFLGKPKLELLEKEGKTC